MSEITLLGIGNIILKDEGFGVWTIDKMQKRIDEFEDKFSRLCQKLGIDESEV